MASLSEYKARAMDIPAMSEKLAQTQGLHRHESPIKQVNVAASNALSQGPFSADNKASVQNFNQQINFNMNKNKKKNKNDFYRFLLQQNMQQYSADAYELDSMGIPIKVNNDILIPRSILKKNEIGPREYLK